MNQGNLPPILQPPVTPKKSLLSGQVPMINTTSNIQGNFIRATTPQFVKPGNGVILMPQRRIESSRQLPPPRSVMISVANPALAPNVANHSFAHPPSTTTASPSRTPTTLRKNNANNNSTNNQINPTTTPTGYNVRLNAVGNIATNGRTFTPINNTSQQQHLPPRGQANLTPTPQSILMDATPRLSDEATTTSIILSSSTSTFSTSNASMTNIMTDIPILERESTPLTSIGMFDGNDTNDDHPSININISPHIGISPPYTNNSSSCPDTINDYPGQPATQSSQTLSLPTVTTTASTTISESPTPTLPSTILTTKCDLNEPRPPSEHITEQRPRYSTFDHLADRAIHYYQPQDEDELSFTLPGPEQLKKIPTKSALCSDSLALYDPQPLYHENANAFDLSMINSRLDDWLYLYFELEKTHQHNVSIHGPSTSSPFKSKSVPNPQQYSNIPCLTYTDTSVQSLRIPCFTQSNVNDVGPLPHFLHPVQLGPQYGPVVHRSSKDYVVTTEYEKIHKEFAEIKKKMSVFAVKTELQQFSVDFAQLMAVTCRIILQLEKTKGILSTTPSEMGQLLYQAQNNSTSLFILESKMSHYLSTHDASDLMDVADQHPSISDLPFLSSQQNSQKPSIQSCRSLPINQQVEHIILENLFSYTRQFQETIVLPLITQIKTTYHATLQNHPMQSISLITPLSSQNDQILDFPHQGCNNDIDNNSNNALDDNIQEEQIPDNMQTIKTREKEVDSAEAILIARTTALETLQAGFSELARHYKVYMSTYIPAVNERMEAFKKRASRKLTFNFTSAVVEPARLVPTIQLFQRNKTLISTPILKKKNQEQPTGFYTHFERDVAFHDEITREYNAHIDKKQKKNEQVDLSLNTTPPSLSSPDTLHQQFITASAGHTPVPMVGEYSEICGSLSGVTRLRDLRKSFQNSSFDHEKSTTLSGTLSGLWDDSEMLNATDDPSNSNNSSTNIPIFGIEGSLLVTDAIPGSKCENMLDSENEDEASSTSATNIFTTVELATPTSTTTTTTSTPPQTPPLLFENDYVLEKDNYLVVDDHINIMVQLSRCSGSTLVPSHRSLFFLGDDYTNGSAKKNTRRTTAAANGRMSSIATPPSIFAQSASTGPTRIPFSQPLYDAAKLYHKKIKEAYDRVLATHGKINPNSQVTAAMVPSLPPAGVLQGQVTSIHQDWLNRTHQVSTGKLFSPPSSLQNQQSMYTSTVLRSRGKRAPEGENTNMNNPLILTHSNLDNNNIQIQSRSFPPPRDLHELSAPPITPQTPIEAVKMLDSDMSMASTTCLDNLHSPHDSKLDSYLLLPRSPHLGTSIPITMNPAIPDAQDLLIDPPQNTSNDPSIQSTESTESLESLEYHSSPDFPPHRKIPLNSRLTPIHPHRQLSHSYFSDDGTVSVQFSSNSAHSPHNGDKNYTNDHVDNSKFNSEIIHINPPHSPIKTFIINPQSRLQPLPTSFQGTNTVSVQYHCSNPTKSHVEADTITTPTDAIVSLNDEFVLTNCAFNALPQSSSNNSLVDEIVTVSTNNDVHLQLISSSPSQTDSPSLTEIDQSAPIPTDSSASSIISSIRLDEDDISDGLFSESDEEKKTAKRTSKTCILQNEKKSLQPASSSPTANAVKSTSQEPSPIPIVSHTSPTVLILPTDNNHQNIPSIPTVLPNDKTPVQSDEDQISDPLNDDDDDDDDDDGESGLNKRLCRSSQRIVDSTTQPITTLIFPNKRSTRSASRLADDQQLVQLLSPSSSSIQAPLPGQSDGAISTLIGSSRQFECTKRPRPRKASLESPPRIKQISKDDASEQDVIPQTPQYAKSLRKSAPTTPTSATSFRVLTHHTLFAILEEAEAGNTVYDKTTELIPQTPPSKTRTAQDITRTPMSTPSNNEHIEMEVTAAQRRVNRDLLITFNDPGLATLLTENQDTDIRHTRNSRIDLNKLTPKKPLRK